MGDGKVCFQQMKKLFMKMTLIAALFFFPVCYVTIST